MNCGKSVRLKRIFSAESNRTIILPLDHGITMGPINGIVNPNKLLASIESCGVNGIVLHKGLAIKATQFINRNTSLIVHLSASTNIGTHSDDKVQVCSVLEALRIGADAVSFHINIGSEYESKQISSLGKVVNQCNLLGMPLMVMAYVRRNSIDDKSTYKIAHVARIAAELGADIVKCNCPDDEDGIRFIVDSCQIPVVIAGGDKKDDLFYLFNMIHKSIIAGASGISIGRNIFQREYPDKILKIVYNIVHEDMDVETAIKSVEEISREL